MIAAVIILSFLAIILLALLVFVIYRYFQLDALLEAIVGDVDTFREVMGELTKRDLFSNMPEVLFVHNAMKEFNQRLERHSDVVRNWRLKDVVSAKRPPEKDNRPVVID